MGSMAGSEGNTHRYERRQPMNTEDQRYSTAHILAYIESWLPGRPEDTYRLEEVQALLKAASIEILDDDYGIDTI